jgi:hypothetical protein
MGTCHIIIKVQDELLGDSLDIEMFSIFYINISIFKNYTTFMFRIFIMGK